MAQFFVRETAINISTVNRVPNRNLIVCDAGFPLNGLIRALQRAAFEVFGRRSTLSWGWYYEAS